MTASDFQGRLKALSQDIQTALNDIKARELSSMLKIELNDLRVGGSTLTGMLYITPRPIPNHCDNITVKCTVARADWQGSLIYGDLDLEFTEQRLTVHHVNDLNFILNHQDNTQTETIPTRLANEFRHALINHFEKGNHRENIVHFAVQHNIKQALLELSVAVSLQVGRNETRLNHIATPYRASRPPCIGVSVAFMTYDADPVEVTGELMLMGNKMSFQSRPVTDNGQHLTFRAVYVYTRTSSGVKLTECTAEMVDGFSNQSYAAPSTISHPALRAIANILGVEQ